MISIKPSMKTCGVLGSHRSDKTDALCRAMHRSERFAIRKSHHSRSEVVSTATLISEAHGKLSSFQMSWLFATHMSSWPEVCDQHLERCWLFYCSSSVFLLDPACFAFFEANLFPRERLFNVLRGFGGASTRLTTSLCAKVCTMFCRPDFLRTAFSNFCAKTGQLLP